MRHAKRWSLVLLGVAALGGVIWATLEATSASNGGVPASPDPQAPEVFTPGHRTALQAIQDFVGWRPKPIQPIAFPHYVHLAKNIQCLACHAGADQGPDAQLPSVNICMTCHVDIAKDKPEIKKVAAYSARGEDIAWQRVYGFNRSAHVKFNHAPHIRAGVTCATCHGDLTKQTVAVQAVNLNMGYCIDCHRVRKASVDCVSCHY